jgi:hypothetical protein
MDDLDLLLTTVFVPADDLLPERRKNARSAATARSNNRAFSALRRR